MVFSSVLSVPVWLCSVNRVLESNPLWCYGVFLCVLMVQFPPFDCTFVPAAERKAKLSL